MRRPSDGAEAAHRAVIAAESTEHLRYAMETDEFGLRSALPVLPVGGEGRQPQLHEHGHQQVIGRAQICEICRLVPPAGADQGETRQLYIVVVRWRSETRRLFIAAQDE
jgi:hypothetical protein